MQPALATTPKSPVHPHLQPCSPCHARWAASAPSGAGRGAVGQQDPHSEALAEPAGHGVLKRASPPSVRHHCNTTGQFRFAYRREADLPGIALCHPGGHGRHRHRTGKFGCRMFANRKHVRNSGKIRRLAHRATLRKFDFRAAHGCKALAGELCQVSNTKEPAAYRISQNFACLFLHRAVVAGSAHPEARHYFFVDIADRDARHRADLLLRRCFFAPSQTLRISNP